MLWPEYFWLLGHWLEQVYDAGVRKLACPSDKRMGSEEEYLRRAREAQKWAEEARSERARIGWLRIAENWLALIDRPRFAPPLADAGLDAPDMPQHRPRRSNGRDSASDEDGASKL
jgi:hypothetical protein